jgi:hypothetical protein
MLYAASEEFCNILFLNAEFLNAQSLDAPYRFAVRTSLSQTLRRASNVERR